nr:MAG TPA_asm: hypothetical protein [Bacteriophage sp.]
MLYISIPNNWLPSIYSVEMLIGIPSLNSTIHPLPVFSFIVLAEASDYKNGVGFFKILLRYFLIFL